MDPLRRPELLLAAVLACGCFGGGGDGAPRSPSPKLDPREVVGFSERIEIFYAALENVPLDAVMTFENPQLRSHFASDASFMDYYSSIANQVRWANMRNTRPLRVVVRKFHFESPDVARVEVMLRGPYQRTLRFWDVELEREDTWKRLDGVWLLTPDKL